MEKIIKIQAYDKSGREIPLNLDATQIGIETVLKLQKRSDIGQILFTEEGGKKNNAFLKSRNNDEYTEPKSYC